MRTVDGQSRQIGKNPISDAQVRRAICLIYTFELIQVPPGFEINTRLIQEMPQGMVSMRRGRSNFDMYGRPGRLEERA